MTLSTVIPLLPPLLVLGPLLTAFLEAKILCKNCFFFPSLGLADVDTTSGLLSDLEVEAVLDRLDCRDRGRFLFALAKDLAGSASLSLELDDEDNE
jgi:hypothetical protein